MSCAGPESRGLTVLLTGFLAGEPTARRRFPEEATPLLTKLTRRYGDGLASNLQPEVVSQVYMNLLLLKPSAFDRTRGTAEMFLTLRVREAIRQIKAHYADPGKPTRVRKAHRSAQQNVSSIPTLAGTMPRELASPPPVQPPLEEATRSLKLVTLEDISEAEQPSSSTTVAAIEASCDAQKILEQTEPELARALYRVLVQEESIQDLADELNISRSTLSRRISKCILEFRERLVNEQQ